MIGMKKVNILLFFISTLVLVGCQNSGSKSSKKEVLFTLGEEPVYVEDFKYVYEKHNSNSDDFYTRKSVEEYLDLYTNFRLKIKEAENLKMDTSRAFIKELAGHRESLAKPYLTEKNVSEELMKEAYDRMQTDVRASHILVLVGEEAEPKDTLKAHRRISMIRQKAVEGSDFAELARTYSEDRSAQTSGGDLGYFGPFSMVYRFEDKAFKTEKGQISEIFRTKFGYHILKVTDKRPTKGKYKVAHIMIRASQGMDKEDSVNAKNKIFEIHSKLKAGESWNELCQTFSEDANSKNYNGELQFIDVNSSIVNEFKNAAFALNDTGEISEPVQTPYGWHIIKLNEKQGIPSYEEVEPSLKLRIERDSRSNLGQKLLLKRLRTENQLVENKENLELAASKADSTLVDGTFKMPEKDKDLDKVLFSIMDEKYTIRDLYSHLQKQKKTRPVSPDYFVRLGYTDFVNKSMLDYENTHLEEKYIDFKMLYKEYRDGILMFNLMDEKVWSQSTEDTVGLKNFFDSNAKDYQWKERLDAVIYDCESGEVAEKVKSELEFGKYPVNNPAPIRVYYEYRKDELSEEDMNTIKNLTKRLVTNKDFSVKLTVSTSKKEALGRNKDIVKRRTEKVKSALLAMGVSEDQIIEDDASFRFDKESDVKKKRSMRIAFLSSTDKALENYMNASSPLALKVKRSKFEKGDQDVLEKIDWKKGNYTVNDNDRTYYIVVNEVLEPRQKELGEVRGEVISDYQEHLEKEWIKTLKNKYPVAYKEDEINKLIKE